MNAHRINEGKLPDISNGIDSDFFFLEKEDAEAVVMPILMNHYVMLQRNLIYTGITRAKKILVMVGTKRH